MAECKEKLYLFGDNEDNRKIYASKGNREGEILSLAPAFAERKILSLIEEIKGSQTRAIVVVNTGGEEENFALCRIFIRHIENATEAEKDIFFRCLRISVFGDPHYQAEYERLAGDGYGCISYVNKYQQIAMDFIERYPLTKFMDGRHIDYQTSLIKKETEIKVFLVGFGKTNRQIFLTSVANNQFLCEGESEPQLKQAEYVVFDKDVWGKRAYLEETYYRFHKLLSTARQEEYLPFPALPSKEEYCKVETYEDCIEEIESRFACNQTDVNYIVIACGSDEENIALAYRLLQKQKKNCTVFVKSRNIRKEDSSLKDENCYFIGNEEDCVFHVDEIIGDRIYRMSQLRNAIYDLEYDITCGGVTVTEDYVQRNREKAEKNWFTGKSVLERESSTYGCLSLRSKLNLMGLDYCGKEENALPALSQEEYLAWYAKGDLPDFTTYNFTADGKPIACYTLDFPDSRRKNMAIHEHLRWNSYMFSKGIIPSTKVQILGEQVERGGKLRYTNGKNYAERRHGNLTTFEGLVEFRQMVAKRDNCSEGEKDVIKYDYQLLDDAFWLLEKSGCKIVRKTEL